MPKNQTIYDKEDKGKAYTITAVSAIEALRKHPKKWSMTPPEPAAKSAPTMQPGPNSFSAKAGEADDLTRIKGIGPATEKKLNDAGVTTFAALIEADHTDARFAGIGDDDDWASWREQAQKLID